MFLLIYGRIQGKVKSESDHRVKIEIVEKEKKIKYKIYIIKDARLYSDRVHDAAIILNNFIVEGPSYQLRTVNNDSVEKNIVFKKGTPRFKKKLNGKVLSLLTGGAGNDNYWHWIFDVLPRFELCSRVYDLKKIDFFLLPSLEKRFQRETLDLLGIPLKKCISSRFFRHISSPEIIVTDHPYVITNDASYDIQNIPTWIFSWLKEKYINKESIGSKIFSKRIYIDRSDSSPNTKAKRLITNENEVKDFLFNNGFESAVLGNLHFEDQVKIFNNAEIIVGLHGAGFSNISFCKTGTKVIELKNTTDGKVIENLALNNDLIYKSINCEAVKFKIAQFGHINVPIESLKKIIESSN